MSTKMPICNKSRAFYLLHVFYCIMVLAIPFVVIYAIGSNYYSEGTYGWAIFPLIFMFILFSKDIVLTEVAAFSADPLIYAQDGNIVLLNPRKNSIQIEKIFEFFIEDYFTDKIIFKTVDGNVIFQISFVQETKEQIIENLRSLGLNYRLAN